MYLSVNVNPLRYALSSLSTISSRNFNFSSSYMSFISCIVSPVDGVFFKASTIFTFENPNIVILFFDDVLIPSRLLGCEVNSTYLSTNLVFF